MAEESGGSGILDILKLGLIFKEIDSKTTSLIQSHIGQKLKNVA